MSNGDPLHYIEKSIDEVKGMVSDLDKKFDAHMLHHARQEARRELPRSIGKRVANTLWAVGASVATFIVLNGLGG